jgi:hypothetical protein
MVSSGRRDPPNGVAQDLSVGSTENFFSDGRGERTSPSPVTQTALRNHWLTVTHPLESLSFVHRHASCGRDTGGHGFRISWKSVTTAFTNLRGPRDVAARIAAN